MDNANFTRRTLLYSAAASVMARGEDAPQSKLGIAATSFVAGGAGGGLVPGSAPQQGARPKGRDAFEFLEKCHALGAAGVQTQINGDIPKLRARAEQLGMWIEGISGIPRNGDMAPLEQAMVDAKAAGATVIRCAMLSGRRYETFKTLADWKAWIDQSHTALRQILP